MVRPVLALVLLLTFTACGPTAQPPTPPEPPASRVTVDGEILEGVFFGGPSEAVFKGIPYAAAPVGELRWRPPQPIVPRSGVQPARDYGPPCVQTPGNVAFTRAIAEVFGQDPQLVPDLGETSEDCLHLNVWTPAMGTAEKAEKLPVMVWIYGGSNVCGTSREIPLDGANLAKKGVVVVTFDYRLNVFGWLAHEALDTKDTVGMTGNYGLLDQIAALHWVRRNVAAFGGDPDRVTIFGESAGALDVNYLMASPLAEGLFHRAISQSGGYVNVENRTCEREKERAATFFQELGIEELAKDKLAAALRAASAEDVLAASRAAYGARGYDMGPCAGGRVLPELAALTYARGEEIDVPLLIGTNAEEWTTLRPYYPVADVAEHHTGLRQEFGDLTDEAMAIYGLESGADREALNRATDVWQGDKWFACPSRSVARGTYGDGGGSDVFFYVFSRRLPGAGGDALRAWHGAEIGYVFDNLDDEVYVPREPYDQELAELMSAYWVNFATTGNPNGDGLPEWPVWNNDREPYLELGDEVRPGAGWRREACELYDRLLRAPL